MATKRKRSRNTISQAEARALKRRVAQLEAAEEQRRATWAIDYPDGTQITVTGHDSSEVPVIVAIRTARRLGHAVVAVEDGSRIRYHALPLPKR